MINLIENPEPSDWAKLSQRPTNKSTDLTTTVQNIINRVKIKGDKALLELTRQFDDANLKTQEVSAAELSAAASQISDALKGAIKLAADNISLFHESQIVERKIVETSPGVICWQSFVGIEKVGLYIPGGTAPLFSTILMLGIPAQLAGCHEIILCTPPDKNGNIDPAILYTASVVGINRIYKIGGAQAIAAMAYGTETISSVFKIFGPGNNFVTRAKQLIQLDGIAIDMPAGPSELLVIADQSCIPEFVAADLLSQAEHGIDSQVLLLSPSLQIIQAVNDAIANQVAALPRKEIVLKSLSNSKAILFNSIDSCISFSNLYAPEHLIIASASAEEYCNKISNAGSVFLGNYAAESAGDYASGTNHTLPTNGFARNYSGITLQSFQKAISFQSTNKKGLVNIGPAIELMASAEQLQAHRNAISIRLKSINNV